MGIWFRIPKRIASFCSTVRDVNPSIPVVIAKELTKSYEQFITGNADEVHQKITATDCRGEWVVMVDARSCSQARLMLNAFTGLLLN